MNTTTPPFRITVATDRSLTEPVEYARFIIDLTNKQVLRQPTPDADDRVEFRVACDAFNLWRIVLRLSQDNGVISIDHPFVQDIVNRICTKREYDADDFASALEATQHRVRHAYGLQPMEVALDRAKHQPLKLLDEAVARSKACSDIAAIAFHLQAAEGERPIFLPIEQLRRLLHLRKIVVSGAVRRLAKSRLLESVNDTYSRGKAREFRFIGKKDVDFVFSGSEGGDGPRLGQPG